MMSDVSLETVLDPVDLTTRALESAWRRLTAEFEVTSRLPDLETLFDGADLSQAQPTAEVVIANMLLEITEDVSRFSPWYKMPCRAFGLVSIRDRISNRLCWILTPDALQKWQLVIVDLSAAFRRLGGILRAILVVESSWNLHPPEEESVLLRCQCSPPNTIRVKQSLHCTAEIICDECHVSFS